MYNYGDGIGSSHGRQYQGYPYVNPMVIDVPSIDATEAARWNNLPRKPAFERKPERPVVYIDIPGSSGTESAVSQPNTSSASENEPATGSKTDPDQNPVVYIDLPESSASDVAERRPVENEDSFVQETIFYDPFKDRRINSEQDSSPSSSTGSVTSNRPSPPNTLSIRQNGAQSSTSHSNIPPSLAKEVSVYGPLRSPEDMFPTTTGNFPEPPPAYSEVDTITNGSLSPEPAPVMEEATEPPRTQVITPDALSPPLLYCMYCNIRAHTLSIKQSGFVTHLIAILFLVCGLFPITIFIYCSDLCKYTNYYCKQCNRKIAYKLPILCKELEYVTN